jgi:hypothetical protein
MPQKNKTKRSKKASQNTLKELVMNIQNDQEMSRLESIIEIKMPE